MLNTQNQELLQAIGCMVGEKMETCFTEYDARLDAKLDGKRQIRTCSEIFGVLL